MKNSAGFMGRRLIKICLRPFDRKGSEEFMRDGIDVTKKDAGERSDIRVLAPARINSIFGSKVNKVACGKYSSENILVRVLESKYSFLLSEYIPRQSCLLYMGAK